MSARLSALREPALIVVSLLPPLVSTLLLFWADLEPDQQAAYQALAVAVSGLVTAGLVARDRLAPAILGFAQALLSMITVWGFALSAPQSAGVMAFVNVAVGMYVRTQVVARVGEDGQTRGRHERPEDA